jgi:D-amino-acid dehydrogenase
LQVAIVGCGAIGATVAYFLTRRGIEVTVFDLADPGHGTSFGNAGLLVPSYSTPLASYGNAMEGLRSLMGRASAVDIQRRQGARMALWTAQFLLAARSSRARRGARVLARLTQRSLELHDEILLGQRESVAYARQGTLYVALTEQAHLADIRIAKNLRAVEIASETLTPAQAREHEPALSSAITGAVFYPEDARLQPLAYVETVMRSAQSMGARIRTERIDRLNVEHGRVVGVEGAGGRFAADRVVVAAGPWSASLMHANGVRLPIVPAKGYSVDLRLNHPVRSSMLFSDMHVSATPFNGITRATTGLDFHGLESSIPTQRLNAIRTAYARFLDSVSIVSEGRAWAGFRPLTPDGLPIIGESSLIDNLFYATGHGALGITLAPVTGELIASGIIGDRALTEPAIAPNRFHV